MIKNLKIINKLSFLALCIVLFSIMFWLFFNLSVDVIKWDVFGYYMYLPAFFIHNDLGLRNLDWLNEIVGIYNNTGTLYQFAPSPLGYNVNQYSMGMAFLYFPFFLLGHAYALISDYPIDGFSFPYQLAIYSGGIFYLVLGLIYLRKILLYFFTDKVAAIVLLVLCLGTNYFQIQVQSNVMPHNFLFAFYAILIWITIKWHEEINFTNSIFLGLIIGVIILARPTEIVCVFIPLFYGIISFKDLKNKISIFYKKRKYISITIVTVFFIGLPQLIYWKTFAGSFIYYSYINNGEGLDLLSPNFFNVLFSFRKGWLIYTPLMLFSILGFYFVFKNYRQLFFSLIIFFIVNLYFISSWSNWWYASSFGQRSLMQSYAVMAIPLGAFITGILKKNQFFRVTSWLLILSFVLLNLFQTWQISVGIIDGSRMTKAYYFSVFGQTTKQSSVQEKLLLVNRTTTDTEIFEHQEDYQLAFSEVLNFENKIDEGINNDNAYSGEKVFILNKEHPFSTKISKTFTELTKGKDHVWIKISLWVYPSSNWKASKLSLIATFEYKWKSYKYRGINSEGLENIIPNQWNKIEMDYLTPEPRTVEDIFSTYAWLRGDEEILIDDLKIEVFKRKY